MFATLLGALPRPPLPESASTEALLEAVVRAQEAAGLDPITDGGVLAGEDPVDGLASHGGPDRPGRQGSASRAVLARRQRRDGATPSTASSATWPMPAARSSRSTSRPRPGSGRTPTSAPGSATLHQRLLDGVTGTHLSLAITGGDAKAAGIDTLLAAPYASLAVDLIAGPDNWHLVVRTPGDRGIICGALPAEADSDDGPGDHRLGGGLRRVDRRPRPGPCRDRDGLVAGAPAVGRRGGQDGAARGRPPDRHRAARRASRGASIRARSTAAAPRWGATNAGPSHPPRRGHDPT